MNEEEIEERWKTEHGVKPQRFIRAVVNGETWPGEDIENVFYPTANNPVWRITIKDGRLIRATGNVLVLTGDKEE